MFEKINYKSIAVSFWIGVAISIAVQLQMDGVKEAAVFFAVSLGGGVVGLFIGAAAEVITSFLPVSIAKPKTYFLISAAIGTSATVGVMFAVGTAVSDMDASLFRNIFITAMVIVASANLLDYANYKRANRRLETFKNSRFK